MMAVLVLALRANSQTLFITLQKTVNKKYEPWGTFPFAQLLPYTDRRLL